MFFDFSGHYNNPMDKKSIYQEYQFLRAVRTYLNTKKEHGVDAIIIENEIERLSRRIRKIEQPAILEKIRKEKPNET